MANLFMALITGVWLGIWVARFPIIRRWRRKLILSVEDEHGLSVLYTFLITTIVLGYTATMLMAALERAATMEGWGRWIGVGAWFSAVGVYAVGWRRFGREYSKEGTKSSERDHV